MGRRADRGVLLRREWLSMRDGRGFGHLALWRGRLLRQVWQVRRLPAGRCLERVLDKPSSLWLMVRAGGRFGRDAVARTRQRFKFMDIPEQWREHLRRAGRAGGSVKSRAKERAAKRNGKLGGRPRKKSLEAS